MTGGPVSAVGLMPPPYPVPAPDPDARRDPFVLSGEIPSPIDIPTGCRLRARCPLAKPVCAEPVPVRQVSPGHFVACHLVQEETR